MVDDPEIDRAVAHGAAAILALGEADHLAGQCLGKIDSSASRHRMAPLGRTRRSAWPAAYSGSRGTPSQRRGESA